MSFLEFMWLSSPRSSRWYNLPSETKLMEIGSRTDGRFFPTTIVQSFQRYWRKNSTQSNKFKIVICFLVLGIYWRIQQLNLWFYFLYLGVLSSPSVYISGKTVNCFPCLPSWLLSFCLFVFFVFLYFCIFVFLFFCISVFLYFCIFVLQEGL